jgi:glyoxylase-like metal-dependent hydrolase (beta-lactamase superfamily II)
MPGDSASSDARQSGRLARAVERILFGAALLANSPAMKTVFATAALLLLSVAARAADPMGDPTKVTLKTTPVAAGISMIEGADGFAGGNVGVSVGADGVFIVDDELQPMTPKLKVALAALSKKPVRFVINTHWHADHTGGNGGLAAAGAILVAHDNVRKRLSVDQFMEFMGQKKTIPASPPGALPVVTFGDDITLHLNGDEVHVFHVPPAHTDGDAIVHFKKANVVHAGDTFVATYPFVDVGSGGQFEGFIAAADRLLAICDDNTKIIPGHGPIMGRADLQAWRDMLIQVRDRVGKLVAGKKTLEQIKAAKPTAEFDAKWGQGFIKADDLVDAVYKTRPAATDKPAGGKRPKK